jgi:hypothetical protein
VGFWTEVQVPPWMATGHLSTADPTWYVVLQAVVGVIQFLIAARRLRRRQHTAAENGDQAGGEPPGPVAIRSVSAQHGRPSQNSVTFRVEATNAPWMTGELLPQSLAEGNEGEQCFYCLGNH